jgi:hypothetical protein
MDQLPVTRSDEFEALLAERLAALTDPQQEPLSVSAEVEGADPEAVAAGLDAVSPEGGVVGAVIDDVATGVGEALPSAGRGAINAINETSHAANSAAQWLNKKFIDLGYVNIDLNPETPLWESSDAREARLRSIGVDVNDERALNQLLLPEFIDESESVTGKLITGVTQFATGMIGAGRILKVGGFSGMMAKGAAVDATVFDPHEERLGNLIQSVPALRNPVTEYLAADENDSEAEGRFKNALEGGLLGLGIEGIFRTVKALKKAKAGKTDEALEDLESAETALKDEGVDVDSALDSFDGLPKAEPTSREATGRDTAAPLRSEETMPVIQIDPDKAKAFEIDRFYDTENFTTKGSVNDIGIDFNFKNITDEGSIKSTLNQLSHHFSEQIQAVKGGEAGGVRTWHEAQKRAARFLTEMGGEGLDVGVQRMMQGAQNAFELDAKVLANRTFMVSLVDEIDNVAKAIAENAPYKGMDGDDLLMHYEQMRTAGVEVHAYMKGMQTNVARALNAFKLQAGTSDKLGGTLAGRSRAQILDDARKFHTGVKDNHSLEHRVRVLKGGAADKFWGLHNEYWINAILSSPKTHVINSITGAVHVGYRPIEKMAAGALTGNRDLMREGFYTYQGYRHAFRDAAKMAFTVLRSKTGDAILDLANTKIDPNMGSRYWTKETFGVKKGPMGQLIDVLGQVIRTSGRLLATEDEFLKQLSFRASVFADAKVKAAAKGLGPEDTMQMIQDRLNNAIAADGHARIGYRPYVDEALQESREATWTQDLEGGIGKSLQDLGGKHPWMRVILPFVRTPTNLMRWTWQRTPGLNRLQFQHRADMRSGDPKRVAMAKARTAMGTVFWGAAITAALEGNFTGAGPRNWQERALKEQTGWKPFSIRLDKGDGTVEYVQMSRADPFFLFFGLAADAADVMSRSGEMESGELAGAMVTAVAANILNKTYLEGLSRALEVMTDPTPENWERYLRNQAASYLPTGVQTFKTDEFGREAYTVLEAMKRKMPGLSESLDPQRNILGEVMSAPTGWGPDNLSPFATGVDTGDDVVNALASFEKGYRPPPSTKGNVDLLADEFKLPPHPETGWRQSAYDRYLELMGTVTGGGKTARQRIQELISSEKWDKLTDGVTLPGMAYPGSKQQVVETILSRYRDKAWKTLLKEQPALREAVRQDERNKRMSLKFGRLSNLNP